MAGLGLNDTAFRLNETELSLTNEPQGSNWTWVVLYLGIQLNIGQTDCTPDEIYKRQLTHQGSYEPQYSALLHTYCTGTTQDTGVAPLFL